MATLCLVIGESGTGKSASIRNLDHKSNFLIQTLSKPLPWRGWREQYKEITKTNAKGNLILTDDYTKIVKTLDYITEKRPDIKTVVIDDFQYIMVNEFMRRHSSAGKGNAVFQLYNEIADHAWSLVYLGGQLARQDLIIFFLSHNQIDETGRSKIKTIGKMLDEKVCLEGMFSIVINTAVSDGRYTFQTQNNGLNTTKSPIGMFDESEIDNDLNLVAQKIREYEKGE